MAKFSTKEELKTKVVHFEPSKDNFEKLKQYVAQNDFEKVYRYFVINRTAYSGIMNMPNWGYSHTKSVQPYKWPARIDHAYEKLKYAKITNLHFRDVISAPSKQNVFMFIDPPYFKADQKRAYFHSFELEDHLELLELLKNTNFKFCLSYDNCEEIQELYSWANIHSFTWRYHTANSKVTTRKMGEELLITNY